MHLCNCPQSKLDPPHLHLSLWLSTLATIFPFLTPVSHGLITPSGRFHNLSTVLNPHLPSCERHLTSMWATVSSTCWMRCTLFPPAGFSCLIMACRHISNPKALKPQPLRMWYLSLPPVLGRAHHGCPALSFFLRHLFPAVAVSVCCFPLTPSLLSQANETLLCPYSLHLY